MKGYMAKDRRAKRWRREHRNKLGVARPPCAYVATLLTGELLEVPHYMATLRQFIHGECNPAYPSRAIGLLVLLMGSDQRERFVADLASETVAYFGQWLATDDAAPPLDDGEVAMSTYNREAYACLIGLANVSLDDETLLERLQGYETEAEGIRVMLDRFRSWYDRGCKAVEVESATLSRSTAPPSP